MRPTIFWNEAEKASIVAFASSGGDSIKSSKNLKLLSGDNDMPRGPKGEKRPADAIGNAIMIAKIATGEIDDLTTDDGKNAAAVALGRMGGKARAEGMSAKRRKEIARKAAVKRWSKIVSQSLSDTRWNMEDIVALIDAREERAKKIDAENEIA